MAWLESNAPAVYFQRQREGSPMTDQPETASTPDFAEALAAATPTPGGGAAAARVGLLATSLVRMVAGISLQKMQAKVSSEESADERGPAILEEAAEGALELARSFRQLEAADIAVFDDFMAAIRLPKESEEEKSKRKTSLSNSP